jgi:IS4 transposase
MYSESVVFAQLMDFLPRHEFNKCVKRYRGNHRVNSFSCRDQFFCMAFAQLTYRESLRDIATCLRALQPKLYHAGLRGAISKSTLADANRQRDWRIYADFANILIAHARKLYLHDDIGFEFEQTAYAFDSTTIDLCLSLFPWAKFRRRKGAIKLHTLIDLRGNIPCFIHFSTGKVHDVNALDHLILEPAAFYMMDRGYVDYSRLYRFTEQMAFFVTRAKSNMKYKRRKMRRVDKSTGLRSDYRIVLSGLQAESDYPVPIRRVAYYDAEHKKRLVFLTNNWNLPALTIARLYKRRWQVELFFKWIKQHLRIKAFYGTTPNAVQTQIWISISIYVLVAIVKKELHLDYSMYQILQILSISLFEKVPIQQALTPIISQNEKNCNPNQLVLFNL